MRFPNLLHTLLSGPYQTSTSPALQDIMISPKVLRTHNVPYMMAKQVGLRGCGGWQRQRLGSR